MDLIVLLLSTKINNHAQTKGKNKMGVIKNTILGIVGLAVVGGATAMAIPQSRNWCLDQIAKHSTIYKTAINERDDARNDAKNKQETINSLNKTVAEKEQALKEAEELIATKNAEIAEKDADIADKQKAIEAKDAEIASKQSTIDEQSANIDTLTEQKTSLLSAVTEIDNKATQTSDSVEFDNLEARKTEILVRIDALNDLIADATTEKSKLQSDVDALTKEKVTLQDEVNALTSDKEQLQQEVATLTTEKQNLQNQIDTLNTQLAEFEQYTLNIDQTNPVESITIEDNKLNTTFKLDNFSITQLSLYAWQNVTVKYSMVQDLTIKATFDGAVQDSDSITIVGSSFKGSTISIGSITQAKSDVLNLREKMFIAKDNQWVVDFETKQVAIYGGIMIIDTGTNKTVNIDGEDFNKYNLNTPLGDSTNYFVWVDNLDSPSKVYCGLSTSDDSDIPLDKSLFVQQTIKNPTVLSDYTNCKTQIFNFSDNTLTLNESGEVKLTGTFIQTDNILTVTWSDGSSSEITLIGKVVLIYNNEFFTCP